jgi:hypothetical protein
MRINSRVARPFDFAEKAYWLQRDVVLKEFVDQHPRSLRRFDRF